MAEDKLHIKLHVYDMDISVNVLREDEIYYRRAAKLIDETVNTYAKVFKNRKEIKEILYMSLIDITLRPRWTASVSMIPAASARRSSETWC